MIGMPTRIFCAVEAIDMRAGIDGLSLCVQQALGKSPCDGSAYVFRNRRSNRIKLLVWDSTGAWLCQRRLHSGSFFGQRPATPHSTSRSPNGTGSSRVWIGSVFAPTKTGTGGSELLVWVAASKFVEHLPLYRLQQIAGRKQVNLSRSTMAQ